MQATIIKQLSKLPTFNAQLAEYLKKLLAIPLEQFTLTGAKSIAYSLMGACCQTRNLLHYRHLEQRSSSEKCLLLLEDVFWRMLKDRHELLEYVTNEFLTHIVQHPSCYVSYTFFLQVIRRHPAAKKLLQPDRMRKILLKIVSCFQEAGEIRFIKDLAGQPLVDWDIANRNLQAHLAKKYKPTYSNEKHQQINISLSKIPPLILPSSKSINSSRYSAISRQQRTKGLTQLKQLASSIGEGFIAVQIGCLLSHKRTLQVQQFSQNSDYRNKCLQKIETERVFSSRLSILDGDYQQNRSGIDRQMDETNRKYYRKVLTVHTNLLHYALQHQLHSPHYDALPFTTFLHDFLDLTQVGIIQGWSNDATTDLENSSEYFSTIKTQMLTIGAILKVWGERLSFITEKKHLRMLWNRNKKHGAYYYEEGFVERQIKDETLLKEVRAVRHEHMKLIQGSLKNIKKDEKFQSDFMVCELSQRLNQLFSLCNLSNPRFYKYQANLLSVLANYLHHSFSNTVQYLSIDLLFPLLLLTKRQIIQLSHPFLDYIQNSKNTQSNRRFSKKEKGEGLGSKSMKQEEPLIVTYPELMCNLLLVLSGIMSNQKHVEKLISTVFIKNTLFMQTLQMYVKWLFENDRCQQIKRVLRFYRHCLQIYNQRKLRNQQSKSIKMLFAHLSAYFYPKVGCIAKKIQQKQYLISASPQISQQNLQQHYFLHELLQFIKDIYYYCQDELAQHLLDEQIACFYIKYSLINFIKLYSFLTVHELVSLQSDGGPLTTKESPHISHHPSINTIYMIDFIRLITSIAVNRTPEISKKIKQYRILQFFIRQFQLEFEVAENVEKYIKKVTRSKEVPITTPLVAKPSPIASSSLSQTSKQPKIPSLNLKSQKFKIKTSEDQTHEQNYDTKPKKQTIVPSLKLPTRGSDRSAGKQTKGVLDNLLEQINEKPLRPTGMQLSLQLGKLNLQKKGSQNFSNAKSSERNLIYSSERKIRKIYSNKIFHSEAILLVLSLLLSKGLLDPQYCDQFPITHGKINVLYILHHHLNQESNRSVIPILAETVAKIKPYLAGQRLLKLLSTNFTDLSHYKNWKKISAGAYGVIYSCQTNIQQPREVAIKQMNFPRSIYERCVLHDIFTEISCLQNFRLDDRVTTMYNYGVVGNAYIIVMKKYDCSLRDWVVKNKDMLHNKTNAILKVFWDVLQILLLLHQKSVTHYDIKADNILLQLDQNEEPVKVVLGDFGECRIFDQSKEELDMKSRGTQCIKSPEMLTLALHLKKEADNYDRRKKIGTTRASDIWSLGCLFYQMLTGEYLYHRSDWVNFYVQVTSPTEDILNHQSLQKLQKFNNYSSLVEYLKVCLVRDPQHRPQIKGAIQKFKDLFGDMREMPQASKSPLAVQKDLQNLVTKYMQQIGKRQEQGPQMVKSQTLQRPKSSHQHNRIRGVRFMQSYNNSKSNRFMRIMEDIFFVQNINLAEGGYQKMKQLKITHVITTINHPQLHKFNTLEVSFNGLNLASLAFRLAPRISDLLRQVLLLKGRLLFINDDSNYATNLLIYTLSYWFRCSVYQTWCLINTQILLFPTFTSDLLALSSALRILNDVEERVEELPKLQCICGSVTFILKELNRTKKRNDLNCKCKRKKINQYVNLANAPECVSSGCQQYLDFIKRRYSISWQSIKWASMHPSSLLTSPFTNGKTKQSLKTQILLNSAEPSMNIVQIGSCVKSCHVYSCRICQMMMFATTENKEQVLLVMNNMLRRIRQGIMIPNAQQCFAKKTPALSYYTLTKLHLTKSPEQ